jgi:hypothetical protein
MLNSRRRQISVEKGILGSFARPRRTCLPASEVFIAPNDHPRCRGGFVISGKSEVILGICRMLRHLRGVDQ